MTNNKVVLGILFFVAIFGFLTIVYMATNNTQTDSTIYPETQVVPDTAHTKWSKDKKHILTEFADLQCPACGMFYQYIKENLENDPNVTKNITFVYRHYPLQQHKYSHESAAAAEAAGKQGKFFEMADLLFTNQKDWESSKNINDYLINAAKKLKLDVNKFTEDMSSSDVVSRINSDTALGNKVTVNSTPTFYLDGKKIEVTSLNDFKTLLTETAKK